MSNKLEYIERINCTGQKPDAVIIWLHGLGADYNDFVPLVSELNLSKCVKFIFPNAPIRPITINNGYEMRGWYDIRDLNDRSDSDDVGILASVQQIEMICDDLISAGVSANKIVIAGFSQGGVISYYCGLLSKYKLGGIIALSCYFPNTKLIGIISPEKLNIPVFSCHVKNDNVVPYSIGREAFEYLYEKKCNIHWYEYIMGHSLCNDEVRDLAIFLNKLI